MGALYLKNDDGTETRVGDIGTVRFEPHRDAEAAKPVNLSNLAATVELTGSVGRWGWPPLRYLAIAIRRGLMYG